MDGQRHALAALPPGKTRYPLYKRLGGPRAVLDRCGKSRPHRDSIPRTVHPVASRYTDYATRSTINIKPDANAENSQYAMNLFVVCDFSAWTHWRLKPLTQRVISLSILDAQNVCPCYANHKIIKVKVKFTLERATKAQRGSRGIALLFL